MPPPQPRPSLVLGGTLRGKRLSRRCLRRRCRFFRVPLAMLSLCERLKIEKNKTSYPLARSSERLWAGRFVCSSKESWRLIDARTKRSALVVREKLCSGLQRVWCNCWSVLEALELGLMLTSGLKVPPQNSTTESVSRPKFRDGRLRGVVRTAGDITPVVGPFLAAPNERTAAVARHCLRSAAEACDKLHLGDSITRSHDPGIGDRELSFSMKAESGMTTHGSLHR